MAVAFNLAYAASEQLRETVKSGFLYGARKIHDDYVLSIKNISSRIAVLIDEDLIPQKRESLENKLKEQLNILKDDETSLKQRLDESQELAIKQIRPYYVIAAIFSLFVLFLGGQESIHNVFPRNELFSMILYMSCMSIGFLILTFSKYEFPIIYAVSWTVVWLMISIFYSAELYSMCSICMINDKYYVDISLFLAYSPFIFATIILTIPSLWLYIEYRYKFWDSTRKLKEVKKNLEAIKTATEHLAAY